MDGLLSYRFGWDDLGREYSERRGGIEDWVLSFVCFLFRGWEGEEE